MIEFVNERANKLQYAFEELRKDTAVVKTAIPNNGYALIFASKEFQKNKEMKNCAKMESGKRFSLYCAQKWREMENSESEIVGSDFLCDIFALF